MALGRRPGQTAWGGCRAVRGAFAASHQPGRACNRPIKAALRLHLAAQALRQAANLAAPVGVVAAATAAAAAGFQLGRLRRIIPGQPSILVVSFLPTPIAAVAAGRPGSCKKPRLGWAASKRAACRPDTKQRAPSLCHGRAGHAGKGPTTQNWLGPLIRRLVPQQSDQQLSVAGRRTMGGRLARASSWSDHKSTSQQVFRIWRFIIDLQRLHPSDLCR